MGVLKKNQKKNQNTPRPSEHPPVVGSKNHSGIDVDVILDFFLIAKDQPPPTSNILLGINTFRWDQRL